MPNLTRNQRKEREAKTARRRKLVTDFLEAVLPRDADTWKPRIPEVRMAFAEEAKTIDSQQPKLTPAGFLLALQVQAIRRRWRTAKAELFNLKFPNFGSSFQKFLGHPKRKRGEVEEVWEYWFQPMNVHQYCRATGLGQTQIKRWLSEISTRDEFVAPAPKGRGKGREKNYSWEVNREILVRWLLLKRHTPEQRKGFLRSLLVSRRLDADHLMPLVEYIGANAPLLKGMEISDLDQLDQFAAEAVAKTVEEMEAECQRLKAEIATRELEREVAAEDFAYRLARELLGPAGMSVTKSEKP